MQLLLTIALIGAVRGAMTSRYMRGVSAERLTECCCNGGDDCYAQQTIDPRQEPMIARRAGINSILVHHCLRRIGTSPVPLVPTHFY